MNPSEGHDEAFSGRDERFMALFSRHPLPMWIYDADTLAFLYVNDAAVARYGYSREEFRAMRITDIRPSEDRDRLLAAHAREARTGFVASGIWRHQLRDGTIIDVDINSGTLELEGRAAELVVVHDVTERRRAEAELRQSEQRKAAILDSVLDCIISMDAQGRVIEFNSAAETTFGYASSDAIGRLLADLIIPQGQRAAHRDGLANYLRTGEGPILGRRIETTAMRADGAEIPVELTVTPIRGGDKSMFIGVLRDMTARKKAEMEVQRLNEEIHRQRLRVFRATMTTVHDIVNNFLNSLQFIRFEAEERLPAETLEMFDVMIKDASTKLKQLGDLKTVNERQMAAGEGIEYPGSP